MIAARTNLPLQLLRNHLKAGSANILAGQRLMSTSSKEPLVLYEERGEKKNVALITLNRTKALNSINVELIESLIEKFVIADKDEKIGALVLTGSMKAFSAGADIVAMKDKNFSETFRTSFLSNWEKISGCTKPTIAAVNGYALGGGCELAMMCDIIYAGDNAKFGQPEITIGTIPGAGGTQRLTKAIGKSRAMEMCLSGLPINAQQAAAWGLASKVIPADTTVDEAVKLAEKIASHSKLIVAMCKESVLNSFDSTLSQGLKSEKRFFHMTFGTKDQKEGMQAFHEKRPAKYTE